MFGFEHFYPVGGWDDFVASFDGEGEAERAAKALVAPAEGRGVAYAQLVDLETGTVRAWRAKWIPDSEPARWSAEPYESNRGSR